MERYTVTGMSCAACSARVEKAVSALPGVISCSVSLLTNSMAVDGTATPEEIVAAVTKAGYGAMPKTAKPLAKSPADDTDRDTRRILCRLIASAALLLPLVYLSMGHTMWGWPLPAALEQTPPAAALLQLLLTAAVMIINGRFFVSGARGLLRRAPNMDTLVAMGAGAAFVYSVCITVAMLFAQSAGDTAAVHGYAHGLYYESAAMILTLITVGKLLESKAKGRTTDALRGLADLSPRTATLVVDGKEATVPAEQAKIGDIFAVRPGEAVPVDGVILDGTCAVDESALTGESIPADKAAGDTVSAATTNRTGYILCRATRVGEDTTLAQIVRLMEEAAATKAPIARLADKVAGVFVPAVMGIALITLTVWLLLGQTAGYALSHAIAVLVISCPCALGLATPVAITVGSGVGAKNGVLFKTAAALEHTGRTKTVVLDKTGTVTAGEPRVTDILPWEITETDLLAAAVTLEIKSEHPLSRAVCRRAEEAGIVPAAAEDFAVLPGQGLTARQGNILLRAGNRKFIEETCPLPPALAARAEELTNEGKTMLWFCADDRLLGGIAVADGLKPDSADAIRMMKDMGLRVVMLTGDDPRTAAAIGRQAGVDEVVAGVLPQGKEEAVRRWMQDGAVTMIGDGINDAPALERADTGMAIGAGTDIAIDAADVVLMNSRLTDAADAIRLGRATLRNIRENLFWAFIYNIIGIPLAAGAWSGLLHWELSPMFGAAAMSLSSFCVVMNALRLNLFRPGGRVKSKKEGKPMTKTLNVEGMMCPKCEAHVKEALEKLPGVVLAEADHKQNRVTLTLSADVADDILAAAVKEAGYEMK